MKLLSVLVCLVLLAGVAMAAAIDGKWVSERKMDRGGQSMVMTTTFDLKSSGNALTGTVTMGGGRGEPRAMPISDGKIDGNNFSFTVVMTTPNGEMKSLYKGAVEGSTLKGTSEREGGGQARPFEATKK